MLSRRAFTLAELIVATALSALVLAAATASLLRQQRTHARVATVTDGDAQARAALLVIGAQLSLLDPLADDLAPGEAGDSALQFRAAVATSAACLTEAGAVTLLPLSPTDTIPLGGTSSDPRAGDTLWWLGDSSWRAAPLNSVSTLNAGCVSPVSGTGTAMRLILGTSDTIPAGSPVRVSRQARFGVYRATDGTWQLGYREWNHASQRFSAPQPVAGPLLPAGAARASGFRYFDSTGAELRPTTGPVDVHRVARIRLTARSLVQSPDAAQDSVRSDSVDIPLRRGSPYQ